MVKPSRLTALAVVLWLSLGAYAGLLSAERLPEATSWRRRTVLLDSDSVAIFPRAASVSHGAPEHSLTLLEGPGAVFFRGERVESITIDLGLHPSLEAPIHVNTVAGERGAALIFSSATSDFPSVIVETQSLEHLSIISHHNNGAIEVHSLPRDFQLDRLRLDAGMDNSTITVLSPLDHLSALSLTASVLDVRATLAGCTSQTTSSPIFVTAPCTCTGTDSLMLSGSSVDIGALVETVDGGLTISASVTGVTVGSGGILQTIGSGELIINAFSVVSSPALSIDGEIRSSADLTISATNPSQGTGLLVGGSIVATALIPGTPTLYVTSNSVDAASSMLVLPGAVIEVHTYSSATIESVADVSLPGMACSSLLYRGNLIVESTLMSISGVCDMSQLGNSFAVQFGIGTDTPHVSVTNGQLSIVAALEAQPSTAELATGFLSVPGAVFDLMGGDLDIAASADASTNRFSLVRLGGTVNGFGGGSLTVEAVAVDGMSISSLVQLDAVVVEVAVVTIAANPVTFPTSRWSGVSLNAPGTCGTLSILATSADAVAIVTMAPWTANSEISLTGERRTNAIPGPAILLDSGTNLIASGNLHILGTTTCITSIGGDMGLQLFFATLQFGALDLSGSVVSDGDDLFGVRSQGASFVATGPGAQFITASVVGTGQDLIGMYIGRAHQFSSAVAAPFTVTSTVVGDGVAILFTPDSGPTDVTIVGSQVAFVGFMTSSSLPGSSIEVTADANFLGTNSGLTLVGRCLPGCTSDCLGVGFSGTSSCSTCVLPTVVHGESRLFSDAVTIDGTINGGPCSFIGTATNGGGITFSDSSSIVCNGASTATGAGATHGIEFDGGMQTDGSFICTGTGGAEPGIIFSPSSFSGSGSSFELYGISTVSATTALELEVLADASGFASVVFSGDLTTTSSGPVTGVGFPSSAWNTFSSGQTVAVVGRITAALSLGARGVDLSPLTVTIPSGAPGVMLSVDGTVDATLVPSVPHAGVVLPTVLIDGQDAVIAVSSFVSTATKMFIGIDATAGISSTAFPPPSVSFDASIVSTNAMFPSTGVSFGNSLIGLGSVSCDVMAAGATGACTGILATSAEFDCASLSLTADSVGNANAVELITTTVDTVGQFFVAGTVDANSGGASGIRLASCDVTADVVVFTGVVTNTGSLTSSNNVGVFLDFTDFTLTGFAPSSIFGLGAGGGAACWGVAFFDSSISLAGPTAFALEGLSSTSMTNNNHGLVMSGLVTFDDQLDAGGVFSVTGTAGFGTSALGSPCHGILAAAIVTIPRGSLHLEGTTMGGPADSFGVNLQGQYFVGQSANNMPSELIVTGQGGEGQRGHGISCGAPVNMSGPAPVFVLSGTALQTPSISGTTGIGVSMFDRFTSTEVASVTVTGVSGFGMTAEYGIHYMGSAFPGSGNMQVMLDGTSNGSGSSNSGVFVQGDLIIGQAFTATGIAGAGASSHGVSFSPSSIVGSGMASTFSISLDGSSSSSEGVLLASTGLWDFGSDDVTLSVNSVIGGVRADTVDLSTAGGLLLDGTTTGSGGRGVVLSTCSFTLGAEAIVMGTAVGVGTAGVEISDLDIVAPSLEINGFSTDGQGVILQREINLSTVSTTITGHSNHVAVRAFSSGSGTIDVIGGSLAVIGDGALNPGVGVFWSSALLSGVISISGTGTNTGISFSGGTLTSLSNGMLTAVGSGDTAGVSLVDDIVVNAATASFFGTASVSGTGVSALPGTLLCATPPCTLTTVGTGSVGVSLAKDVTGFNNVTIHGQCPLGNSGVGVHLQGALAAPAQVVGSCSGPFSDIVINVPFSSPGNDDISFDGDTTLSGSGTLFGDKTGGTVEFLGPFENAGAFVFGGSYESSFAGAFMSSAAVQFMQSGLMEWSSVISVDGATVTVTADTIFTDATVTLVNGASLTFDGDLSLPVPSFDSVSCFAGSGSTVDFNGSVDGHVCLSGPNSYIFPNSLAVDTFVAGPSSSVTFSGTMLTASQGLDIAGSLLLDQSVSALVQLTTISGPMTLAGSLSQATGDIALIFTVSGPLTLDAIFSHAGPTLVNNALPAHLGGSWPTGHDLSVADFLTGFVSSSAQLPNLTILSDGFLEMGTTTGDTACFASVEDLTLQGSTVTFDLNQPGACVLSDSLTVLGNLRIEDGGNGQGGGPSAPRLEFRVASTSIASTVVFQLFDVAGTTTGEFSNLQEGDAVIIAGTTLDLTYLYAGNNVALVGDLPPGVDDEYSTIMPTLVVPAPGVLENDRIAPEPSLSVVLSSPATAGTVMLQPDGSFTYVSNGFVGTTTFTYQIVDGPQLSQPVSVFITVIFVPPSPIPSSTPSETKTATVTRSSTTSASESNTATLSHTATRTPSASIGSPSTTPSFTATVTPSRLPSTALEAPPPPGSTPTVSVTPAPAPSGSRQPSPSAGNGSSGFSPNGADVDPIVEPINTDSNGPVTVMDSNGDEVGSVMIPPSSNDGVLVVTGAGPEVQTIPQVSSAILDITVVDSSGQQVTQFDDDIEICFSSSQFGSDDVCLGFYTDSGTWQCEDYCLDESNGQLCGRSDHLTNFALLLSGDAGSSSRCGSSSQDFLILYLSIAFVGGAICVVIFAIIILEVRVRQGAKKTSDRLTRKLKNQNSLDSSGGGGSSYGFVEPAFEE